MSLRLVLLGCIPAVLVHAQNSTFEETTLTSDVFKINRVIGGTAASKGEFPWQLSLQLGSLPYVPFYHMCGGSIIRDRWLVTAAHCVQDIPENFQLIVKAGKNLVMTREETEQTAYVDKIFTHKDYLGSVAPFDIALVKLKAPLRFNEYVQPIAIPETDSLPPKGKLILSGWGSISKTTEPVMPNELQKATLTFVDLNTCKQVMQSLKQKGEIHDTNLCTGPLNGQFSACNGDSGGPLIEKNGRGMVKLVGVVSWGMYPCGGGPAIFTKVAAFKDWINSVINNN